LRDGCRNLRMLAYFPGTPLLDAPSRDVSSPLFPGRHLLFSFPDALRYDRAMTWDPMRDLRALHERLSSDRAHPWPPPSDVYETHAAYVITDEVPGVTRDQIDLAVEHTRLAIRGRRLARATAPAESVRYHQVERGHGPFARTFEFAQAVN